VLRFLLIIFLGSTVFFGQAQISIEHDQLVQSVQELKVHSMPLVDNQALLLQEFNKQQNGRPVYFAQAFPTDINPSQSGTWEELGETAIWRLIVESKSAYSINLGFSKFFLPSQAKLYVYDYYKQVATKPFIEADNEEHEQLWTPIISTDKIVIELNVPLNQKEVVALQLSYVNHDFLDIQKSATGDCHIDVRCDAENGNAEVEKFKDQIRSVGLFTLSGNSICSGFLINNTRQDCTPYFMTANHCNLNASNAPSMVTYWNYENSECRQVGSESNAERGDGSFETFNTGATWKAGWEKSDFTLVELDDEVPEEANAYFAGWDIGNNPPAESVLIHHPNLEEKRISFAKTPLFTGAWGSETIPVADGNHLVLDHWDIGSSEGGSSGGPLFNRAGLVVGQLHGGAASCDNQEYDAFGRLFSSWTGGGTANTRLRDWLDPDGSGELQLEGKNCVFEIALSDNNRKHCITDGFFTIDVGVDDSFLNQVQLTFEGLPNGVSAFYSEDNIVAGQTSTLTITNIQNLASGNYSFDIVADNGTNKRVKKLFFEISNVFPSQPVLTLPTIEAEIGVDELRFEWNSETLALSYDFQLAEDPNFANIVLEDKLAEANIDLDFSLLPNQKYYWRVKSSNICGTSIWSSVSTFSTIELNCVDLFTNQSLGINIDAPSVITSVIENEMIGTVQNIEITNIRGVHSFISDLKMSLISPSGIEVVLLDRKCASNQDFNLGFSDSGADLICPLTNGFAFKPEMSLSAFHGELALGQWTLKVQDVNKFDGGSLDAWSLNICVSPVQNYSITAATDSVNVCANESYDIPIQLGESYSTSTGLSFESSNAALGEVSFLDGEAVLQINPASNFLPGIYSLEIIVSDEADNTSFLQLRIEVVALPKEFDLLLPEAEAIDVEISPTFSWFTSEHAVSNQLQVSQEADFEELILSTTTSQNQFTLMEELSTGVKYYWRVVATNECGSVHSQVNTFTTQSTNSVFDQNETAIKVYPNPGNKVIHITMDQSISLQKIDLSLYTLDGKKILHETLELSSNQISLNIEHLPAGMYILSAKLDSQTHFTRIVVQ